MLDRYQKEATKTFKEHVPLDAYQARVLNWAIGLSGETGEVAEILKHHIFANEKLDKMELAKEIGDVLWYLTAIAETTGISMVDIAELNLAKLNHRYHTGAYTDGEAQTRHSREKLFKDTPTYQILESRILHKTAPMNVIFIGPDGSGKTTLAKEVAAKMGFKYHKCDYLQENRPALAKQLLDEQINVVYDRFYWPDDALYSKVKGISLPEDYWQEYDAVIDTLQTNNTLFIYVTCNTEELKERSKAWADDYVSVDMLDSIKNNYSNWLRYVEQSQLRLSTCTIDTTGIKPDSDEFRNLVQGCCCAIESGQEIYAGINDGKEREDTPEESFDGGYHLYAKEKHKERVAKNDDRIAYAIDMFKTNNIEFVLKNPITGHFHCRTYHSDKLIQFWAGTGKILGRNERGIHNLIRILLKE